MSDRLAAHRPPTITKLSPRTRLAAIGAAAMIPALLSGMLGSTHSGTPHDSGVAACAYPLATQDVSAAEYTTLRAEFAGSRFPDLRNAGTAYVDLAVQLLHARGTDGYQTVWFYQRLSAACAKHGVTSPSHAAAARPAVSVATAAAARVFVSPHYGYTVALPAGWSAQAAQPFDGPGGDLKPVTS